MIRLMNPKNEESEKSFLESLCGIIWGIIEKIGNILISIIKRILNWMLNG